MKDNTPPLEALHDEHLEARITAYALGEASPFEAAEIESLVDKSPELKLFLNRTRALHTLLNDAEVTPDSLDKNWKLPAGKKIKLARLLGETPEIPRLPAQKGDNRRFARIAIFTIAACALFAAFIIALTKPQLIERTITVEETLDSVGYAAIPESPKTNMRELAELKKAIRAQEDKVEAHRNILTAITRSSDIAYYGAPQMESDGAINRYAEAVRPLHQYNDIEAEKVQLETQIDSLLKYEGEQLAIYASGLDLPDNIIKTVYPQYLELKRQVDGLKASGLADKHPTVQTNQRVLDSMKDQLDEGVANLRTRLQGQLETSNERLAKVENMRDEQKLQSIERSIDTRDYGDAKRDFESDQALLEEMKLSLVAKEIEAKAEQGNAKTLAANASSLSSIPVPSESAIAANESDFGNGDDFGSGWGEGKKKGKSALGGETPDDLAFASEKKSAPTGGFRRSRAMVVEGLPIDDMAAAAQQLPEASGGFSLPNEAARSLARKPSPPTTSMAAVVEAEPALKIDQLAKREVNRQDIPGEDPHQLVLDGRQAPLNGTSALGVLLPDEEANATHQLAAKDNYWDTSGILSNGEAPKGGIGYEIHEAYSSEYLFRGIDLSSKSKSPTPVDLADLSQEIPATQEPFSTFSLNISDASFQLARTAIEKGERPDPSSIKPEQFYNSIDYGDPAPSSRQPVAAAIDQTAHPVIPGRNLVRIAVRTASTGRSAAQPLRLTLLVDQSGSMVRADRRAAMETALSQLATLLTEQDEVTVIGFSRTPRLLADSLPGNHANKLPDLINQKANEGGTNLEEAINLASELALRHKLAGAQNRIVLFTDGAANLGNADPERLSEKVETLRQQGLAFDIAGIGTDDLNDSLLAELARHGNGRYYLVGENTASSLAAQLAGAFRPAAENVKVQVKLNPDRVGNYKLIGFEKDRLKTEDFRNDSVDAAELAADEAGVAMYQIEALPEGTGEVGEVSIRFRDTASGEMVERTWTIPYVRTTGCN